MVGKLMKLEIYLEQAWFWVGNQLPITINYSEFADTEKAYVFDRICVWKDVEMLVEDCREKQRLERIEKQKQEKQESNKITEIAHDSYKMSFAGSASIEADTSDEAILKLKEIGEAIESLNSFKEFSIEDIIIEEMSAVKCTLSFMGYVKIKASNRGMALKKFDETISFYDLGADDVVFDE